MARQYGQGRTEMIGVMVSTEERERVRENAEWFGMTVSEYLRHAALGGTVERPTLRQRKAQMEAAA